MFKISSFSGTGGSCVAVDREFKVSTFTADSGTCVAVARGEGDTVTAVRNSNDPEGPCVHFTEAEWQPFIAGVKAGEFD